MKHAIALTMICLLVGVSGGCTSMFRYGDEDPQPPRVFTPTTLPSTEVADTSTVKGALREAFIDFPVRMYDYFNGRTAATAAVALEDSGLADRRREGLVALVDNSFGKEAPYTTRYQQIATFDADPLVRATAIRALNRSRAGESAGTFVAALDDESPVVRLEAAKALSNVPSPNSTAALLKVFTNASEVVDVRVAAADALRNCKTIEVARALINVLNEREFSIAWQSRQSLRAMTGSDMRYDQTAWLNLITGPTNPLG